jgi:hypothetical protein
MIATNDRSTAGNRLVGNVICPHCWHKFAPEEVLWVSEHTDLFGDTLVKSENQRFLPSRFTPQGDAVDAMGLVCRSLACPQCHLSITRGLLESEPLFLSMLGAPASGKSFFLAAATWRLREVFTNSFGVTFQDADPAANLALNAAEESLFLNPNPDRISLPTALIKKTDLEGDLYDTIAYHAANGTHNITYPRPYLFSLQLHDRHPLAGRGGLDNMLCLYDNAGEDWRPGSDTPSRPVTRHLALSKVLLYLFDPTQDGRFREAARQSRPDSPSGGDAMHRQETILSEAAARIRRYGGLAQNAKIDRLLIVVVPKFDSWGHLLENRPKEEPWRTSSRLPICGFLAEQVDQVSASLRELLRRYCPSTVASAEALSSRVVYIPVSALGDGIATDPATGKSGVRPASIRPFWVTVPFFYAIQSAVPGLIPRVRRPGSDGQTAST